MNQKKPLTVWSLGLMSVVIVSSLQIMTGCAIYGSSLLFFFPLAIILFFLPCLWIIGRLVLAFPITGGSYIWVERAFGKNLGFFTVCIQWLCNLIWYPTIFSLIATSLAYIIAPDLASNKIYIFGSTLFLFWGITFINSLGIKISGLVSAISALVGVILPSTILIALGIMWIAKSYPMQIAFDAASIFPDFTDLSQVAFLTQILISFIGLEMAFVHVGDLQNPSKSIPRALALSASLILFLVILAPLSVAVVIPKEQIHIIAGVLDAIQLFFSHFQLPHIVYLAILTCVFIGNCGNVTAWMISATRGMHVACNACHMPPFLCLTNRYGAPLGILVFEAIIFSICVSFFLFFDTISNAYWILLVLACQVALIYYLFIFAAAVSLECKKGNRMGYKKITISAAIVASFSVLVATSFGFVPPSQGSVSQGYLYPFSLAGGIIIILGLPFMLLKLRRN
ncbi:MAG: amino acid permease [Chlamydiales bacterium]|nr:amino acid permease [Chlamydiales bacterium]